METLSTPTSVGTHGQPCLSGMASKETGSSDISHMCYDNVSVPAVISTFSGLPSCMETFSTPTSVGIHGQPCLSGTASKETGSCDISHMSHDCVSVQAVISTFSGLPS